MKKRLINKIDKWYNLSIDIKKECLLYLSKLLEKNGNRISWEGNIDLPEFVSIVYDGGNHPEYASNAFSTVYGITAENGEFYLQTEDCDKYNVDDIMTYELCNILSFLDTYKKELGIK